MKTNLKKELTRWGLLVALGAMLIGFTQCIGTQSSSVKTNQYSSDPVEVPTGGLIGENPSIIEEAPDVGVKDYERVFHTMSALTGVPLAGNVLNEYNSRLKAQLPSNSRMESLSETNILGIAKMASEFCDSLLNSGTMRSAIWPAATFNFGSPSNTFWAPNSNTRTMFIEIMMNRFWGEGVLTPVEYDEGRAALNDLVTDMMSAHPELNLPAPTSNGTTTLNIAKAACTVALSSAHVYYQ